MRSLPARRCDLCLIVVAAITVVHSQRQLRYALFISGPDGEFDASGAVPAMELAEEYILRNESVLNGYDLRHSPVEDTLCNRSLSLSQFFATVPQATPPVLGLLGCGCSAASEPVAEIIHHWNISQVAYDSSALVLSNRERFINFFRTYPSDVNFAPAVISFLQFYGWNRIMFITLQEGFFTGMYQNLAPMLMANKIEFKNRMVPDNIPMLKQALSMTNFFFPDDDFRVIFVNTYSHVGRIIMCEAMKTHNIVGFPRYVWITYAWYRDEWWTSAVNDEPIRCSEDELVQLLRLSLAIEIVPVPDDPNAVTDVNLTTNEFNKLYIERLSERSVQENNYTFSFVAPIAYDAVWSFALALNRTTTILGWPKDRIVQETNCEDDGKDLEGFRLDDFTYNHSFVGCIVRWSLAQTKFIGVSGLVTFDKDGTREQAQVTMVQYRQDSADAIIRRVMFGRTDSNISFEYIENETTRTVFPDGVPFDGSIINSTTTFHLSLVIIYDLLAFLGLIFTTVCLTFNFVFRKRKVVRLTSPNLNYFIIAGSYIMYASIFIRLMPSTDETVNYVRCNLQILLTTFAYCLAFGTILAKVGRVYHIFNNPTEKRKKPLTDWHLAVIVLAITGVGVLMAILGWSIPQLRATPTLVPDGERTGFGRNELGIRIQYQIWECSHVSDIVNIIIFVYLGFLQLIGIILALQTRKVKVKVLNDSKYIAALVYISSIVLIIIAIIRFTLANRIHVTEVFYSGGLILATTAFLSLTFIPKMISLYRDPLGEKIFSKHQSTIEVGRAGALSIRKKADGVTELEERIKELEALLKAKDNSTMSFRDQKSDSVLTEDKPEQVDSNGRYEESNDSTNHLELNYRERGEQENGDMYNFHSVTAV